LDLQKELPLNSFKVDFDSLEWQQGRPGVRFKVYCHGSRQLRLVEFATTDGDPHWCERGHIGYVLQGGLEIEVNGRVDSLIAGDGLFIPPGAATSHRGVRIVQGTRLLMVEDL
jgi:quercetin dioxygenase-like cupin family protein